MSANQVRQHLDIDVDGRPVAVPALIGIDPAVGFAPLHVHDTSDVVTVESPTVHSYTLGPPGDPGVVRHSRTTPLPDPLQLPVPTRPVVPRCPFSAPRGT
jgi:hypothetical protein